jgi:uncharacterized protein (TIGR00266 family)
MVEPNPAKERYRRFVDDYQRGVERAELCARYDIPAAKFDEFVAFLRRQGFRLAPPIPTGFARAHEIDFAISGDDMQYVEVELDPRETAIAEAGAMLYIEPGIEMETIFGDGSRESEGVMARIFGAGKRILIGESLFMTAFTNGGARKQRVAFSAPYPGKILAMDLASLGGELICQKDAFLCAAKGVSIDIAFQRRLGAGLFGGEGFILERLRGDGYAFVHAGGTVLERELVPGETLRIDTGCLVAMQPRIAYDIQFVGGIKTALFGGEGLFFATLAGPGRVWLQSLPFSRLAGRILAALPSSGGSRKGEGSLLGTIGDAVMGDRF